MDHSGSAIVYFHGVTNWEKPIYPVRIMNLSDLQPVAPEKRLSDQILCHAKLDQESYTCILLWMQEGMNCNELRSSMMPTTVQEAAFAQKGRRIADGLVSQVVQRKPPNTEAASTSRQPDTRSSAVETRRGNSGTVDRGEDSNMTRQQSGVVTPKSPPEKKRQPQDTRNNDSGRKKSDPKFKSKMQPGLSNPKSVTNDKHGPYHNINIISRLAESARTPKIQPPKVSMEIFVPQHVPRSTVGRSLSHPVARRGFCSPKLRKDSFLDDANSNSNGSDVSKQLKSFSAARAKRNRSLGIIKKSVCRSTRKNVFTKEEFHLWCEKIFKVEPKKEILSACAVSLYLSELKKKQRNILTHNGCLSKLGQAFKHVFGFGYLGTNSSNIKTSGCRPAFMGIGLTLDGATILQKEFGTAVEEVVVPLTDSGRKGIVIT